MRSLHQVQYAQSAPVAYGAAPTYAGAYAQPAYAQAAPVAYETFAQPAYAQPAYKQAAPAAYQTRAQPAVQFA